MSGLDGFGGRCDSLFSFPSSSSAMAVVCCGAWAELSLLLPVCLAGILMKFYEAGVTP